LFTAASAKQRHALALHGLQRQPLRSGPFCDAVVIALCMSAGGKGRKGEAPVQEAQAALHGRM